MSQIHYNSRLIVEIEKDYEKLPVKKTLTEEQEKEIQDYFYNLTGKNVPTNWHKFCFSRNDIYSKKYIPYTLYEIILHKVNNCAYRPVYGDKNMLDVVLPNTHHPNIILKNMNGYFYYKNKPVSKEESIELCKNLGRVLIKPSLKARGDDIIIVDIKDGITNYNNLTLSQLLEKYNNNFSIQEIAEQHEDMKKLNETSVNTIRILSYRSNMEILILYTAIRIGRNGSTVDNESKGGISAKILNNGVLNNFAISKPEDGKLFKTDSGIILDGYKIPSYNEAVNLVKEQHFVLPFFNLIGWDIAIAKDGKPLIIEINIMPDLSQSACGPAFGEYTDRILKEIFNK